MDLDLGSKNAVTATTKDKTCNSMKLVLRVVQVFFLFFFLLSSGRDYGKECLHMWKGRPPGKLEVGILKGAIVNTSGRCSAANVQGTARSELLYYVGLWG